MSAGAAIDFFMRLTRVVGSDGGLFVAGDVSCFCLFIDARQANQDSIQAVELGALDFLEEGQTLASTYHKVGGTPVFLIGGERNEDNDHTGIIMYSNNGRNWTRVYTLENDGNDDNTRSDSIIQAIVWDGNDKRFYASGHISTQRFVTEDNHSSLDTQVETDVLLQSADGQSWSEAGRESTTTFPGGASPPTAGLIVSHCSNRVQDANGNNVPDGVYYFEDFGRGNSKLIKADGLLPVVDYAFGGLSFREGVSSIIIETTSNAGTTSRTATPGVTDINAVACAGDVIVVVGGAPAEGGPGPCEYAVSVDNGINWVTGTFAGFPPAVTVSAGPGDDFPEE